MINIQYSKKNDSFSSKIRNKLRMSILTNSIQHSLIRPGSPVREGKKSRVNEIRNKEVKLSLFAKTMITLKTILKNY